MNPVAEPIEDLGPTYILLNRDKFHDLHSLHSHAKKTTVLWLLAVFSHERAHETTAAEDGRGGT